MLSDLRKTPWPYFGGEGQQKRERLWLSPACLDAPAQLDLVGPS